jgi:hypothetical protein
MPSSSSPPVHDCEDWTRSAAGLLHCTAESRRTIARAAVGSCLYGATEGRHDGQPARWWSGGVGDQSLLRVLRTFWHASGRLCLQPIKYCSNCKKTLFTKSKKTLSSLPLSQTQPEPVKLKILAPPIAAWSVRGERGESFSSSEQCFFAGATGFAGRS